MTQRTESRDGASVLCEPRRCSLEQVPQRLRRERLCEVSEATGLKRSRANGGPVVRSHVDVPGSSSTKNKVAIWLVMRAHGAAASLHEVRKATLPGCSRRDHSHHEPTG